MVSTFLEALQHNWAAATGFVGIAVPTSIIKWIDAHERFCAWREKQQGKRDRRRKT